MYTSPHLATNSPDKMRKPPKAQKGPTLPPDRLVLHLADGLREILDADDVFYLEAADEETIVRLRGRRERVDVRPLGDLLAKVEHCGFVRIHRSYAVNLRKVRFLRRRPDSRYWEVKLEPPVNRVLPVSHGAYAALMAALEG